MLLAAHMDEVGLMVVDHDCDGTLRFEVVGGMNERVLLGKPVLVGPQPAAGRHWRGAGASARSRPAVATVIRAGQMRIDIGAASPTPPAG